MQSKQRNVQLLGLYEEAVGTLSELTIDQGFLIARISKVLLALPPELECKLALLMGTRIGILRTDIPGKEYLVRSILEENALVSNEINKVDLTMQNVQREKAST